MKLNSKFVFFSLILIITLGIACDSTRENATKDHYNIDLVWSLDSIHVDDIQRSFVSMTIQNNEDFSLSYDNWELHFNHVFGVADPSFVPSELQYQHINGDYFSIKPQKNFPVIPPGENYKFSWILNSVLKKRGDAPQGFFLVKDERAKSVNSLDVRGFNSTTLESLNPPSYEDLFRENETVSILDSEVLPTIIPRPVHFEQMNGRFRANGIIQISAHEALGNEVDYLTSSLQNQSKIATEHVGENGDIRLILETGSGHKEGYQLEIDSSGIDISGSDPAGIFYGIQSLMNLLDPFQYPSEDNVVEWPQVKIIDFPRFTYRGSHIDVARNFLPKKDVMELLDVLSKYKINKFLFHLSDDEGWRLEIDDLPELTELGSKRGFTRTEEQVLFPAYGSGPDPSTSRGSGYYSRSDFIEILQYARKRHIEVIPELGFPGHARAAIKAMEARYLRLIKEGSIEEAEKYLLSDMEDESRYLSAQLYNDNVICICRPGAFNFFMHVYGELIGMYQESGTPLRSIHTGGDEMPFGPWQESPICQDLIDSVDHLNNTEELPSHFFEKILAAMEKHEVQIAGWEEIVLEHTEAGHDGTVINEQFIGKQVIPYVWNSVLGWGREDMAYKLANLGFKVIMSNSAAYYFDMAYDRGIEEYGLNWSGYVNTKRCFEAEPFNLFSRVKEDMNGNPLSQGYLDSKVQLTDEGKTQFLGIQSQIWSETASSDERFYYLFYPKILGFAERAWGKEPTWSNIEDIKKSDQLFASDWNEFANMIGQREFMRIEKSHGGQFARIPPAGVKVFDDSLFVNMAFPGMEVRFTTDGSEPNVQSQLYEGPVFVDGKVVHLSVISPSGRAGRVQKIAN